MKYVQNFGIMCLVSDSSAVGIFTQIKDAFQKYNIPLENVIGLSLDNASVNMGKHKGLYRHFEKHSSGIYTAGCACHIIHNTHLRHSQLNLDSVLMISWLIYFTILIKAQNDSHH